MGDALWEMKHVRIRSVLWCYFGVSFLCHADTGILEQCVGYRELWRRATLPNTDTLRPQRGRLLTLSLTLYSANSEERVMARRRMMFRVFVVVLLL